MSAPSPDTDAIIERIRELNERIITAGRAAGDAWLKAYERSLATIASYEEQVGRKETAEWISTIATTQADFLRQFADLVTSTARDAMQPAGGETAAASEKPGAAKSSRAGA